MALWWKEWNGRRHGCDFVIASQFGNFLSSYEVSTPNRGSVCLRGGTTAGRPEVEGCLGKVHFISLWAWPLTSDPENFSAIPTHMMNICGKFYWNSSTKFRDIAASEIGVNRRTTDRRKYNLKPIRPPPPIVGGGGEGWHRSRHWSNLLWNNAFTVGLYKLRWSELIFTCSCKFA